MWWTLIAAGLASFTALAIAFIAYPWQKRQDRTLELQREKRAYYSDLVRSLASFHKLSNEASVMPAEFFYARDELFGLLHLYAPETVIDACYELLDAHYNIYFRIVRGDVDGEQVTLPKDFSHVEQLAEDLRFKQAKLFRLLRKDISGEDIDFSKLSNMDAIFSLNYEIHSPKKRSK